METLLQWHEINIQSRDNNSRTPLWWAVDCGHYSISKLLIQSGAEVDAEDCHQEAILERALRSGDNSFLKLLLYAGARIRDSSYKAIYCNHDLRELALQHNKFDIDLRPAKGHATPLEWAIFGKYQDAIDFLLESDRADVNAIDHEDGTTLLMKATHKGYIDAMELLLNADKIDVNIRDFKRYTALEYAYWARFVEHSDWAPIKLLLQSGKVNLNMELSQGACLLEMCLFGHNDGYDTYFNGGDIGLAKFILQTCNVDASLPLSDGRLLLIEAMDNEILDNNTCLDYVKCLVRSGNADVNLRDGRGRTPLTYAVTLRKVEIVRFLLDETNVDVNMADDFGSTPLGEAIRFYDINIIKLLLSQPTIDVNRESFRSYTPLTLALENEQRAFDDSNAATRTLLAHPNIDVYRQDGHGTTPFEAALFRCSDWDLAIKELTDSGQFRLTVQDQHWIEEWSTLPEEERIALVKERWRNRTKTEQFELRQLSVSSVLNETHT